MQARQCKTSVGNCE
ncbi:hypothetical protein Nmel_010654 [Mimus melanotis]